MTNDIEVGDVVLVHSNANMLERIFISEQGRLGTVRLIEQETEEDDFQYLIFTIGKVEGSNSWWYSRDEFDLLSKVDTERMVD